MNKIKTSPEAAPARNTHRPIITALIAFLILRLWFSLLGIVGLTVRPMAEVEPQNAHSHEVMQALESSPFQHYFLSPWYRFDTVHYLEIAEAGYTPNDHNSAFAPLFPALIRLVNLVIPSAMGSAMLVANLAAFASFWLFLQLLSQTFSPGVANRALVWLAVFPSTFILFQPYSESLFFALFLWFLISVQRKQWGWAALAAGLATLSRFQGIYLAAVLLWEGFAELRRQKKLELNPRWILPTAASIIPALFLAGFLLYLRFHDGASFPWESLAVGWGERFAWPWEGIIGTLRSLFTHPPVELVIGLFLNVFSAIYIPIVLVLTRKQIPIGWSIFFWLLYLTSVTKITPNGELHSAFRYFLSILPVYLFLGSTLVKKWPKLLGTAVSLSTQAALLLMFYLWIWVF